jgi:hypothetical protein
MYNLRVLPLCLLLGKQRLATKSIPLHTAEGNAQKMFRYGVLWLWVAIYYVLCVLNQLTHEI